jgi:hypothetical protein
MTVSEIMAQLSATYELSIVDDALELNDDVPAELARYAALLQTGIRAKLTGRRWFGINAAGRGVGPGVDGALDFHRLLPLETELLCVEGDLQGGWDRIGEKAKRQLADAFEPMTETRGAKKKWHSFNSTVAR